jgi:hypothetical protein
VSDEPHEFDWFLPLPSESAAESASTILSDLGFRVNVLSDGRGSSEQWVLTATLVGPLSLHYIIEGSTMMTDLASDHGGVLDGWGAMVETVTDSSGDQKAASQAPGAQFDSAIGWTSRMVRPVELSSGVPSWGQFDSVNRTQAPMGPKEWPRHTRPWVAPRTSPETTRTQLPA